MQHDLCVASLARCLESSLSRVDAGNGLQGFQTPIPDANFIVDGMGALGNTHTERGLSYFEVDLSGHM